MNPAQTEDNRPTDYKFSKSELFKYTLLDAPYAVSCLTNEIGDLFIFYLMDNDMVRLRKRKNYKVRKSNACVKAAIQDVLNRFFNKRHRAECVCLL